MKLTKEYIRQVIKEELEEALSSSAERALKTLTKDQYGLDDKGAEEINNIRMKLSTAIPDKTINDEDMINLLKMQGVTGQSDAVQKAANSKYAQDQAAKPEAANPDVRFNKTLRVLSKSRK